MRENYAGKMLATCLAILALLGLAFAYSADVSDASNLGSLRSSLSVPAETEVAGALETAEGVEPVGDFDPFVLPLVLPEVPTIDITSAVEVARWGADVSLTIGPGEFRFESSGLPNHELPNPFLALVGQSYSPAAQWNELTDLDRTVELVPSPIDQTITLNPVVADSPSEAPAGLIGVLINGAQLYNDGDVIGQVEPDTYETGYVDLCNGHPAGVEANGKSAGSYHYHAVPTCTTDGIDVEGQHSSIVGVLIDGFPVYGSNDAGGAPIERRQLDECSGHFGPTPEFPDGIYHYHLLDEISPEPISCLVGEITNVDNLDDGSEADFGTRSLGLE